MNLLSIKIVLEKINNKNNNNRLEIQQLDH